MTSGGHSPVVELEILPPRTIAVGRGNAFVIGGYCYHPEFPTRGLSVRVGGTRQHVERARLPRDDVYARVNPDDPVAAIAYRSGFVALVDLAPVEQPERLEIELILTLEDGDEVIAPAGWTDVEPELAAPSDHSPPPSPGHAGPLVSICMATYEPPDDLLRIQLESIREQTHENWVCVISDDHSSEGSVDRLRELTGGDSRFVVSRSPERLGFYRNFERALAMAPAEAEFVTLCDQDDRWHPDKLERLIGGIGGAQLAYSDARIVSPDGERRSVLVLDRAAQQPHELRLAPAGELRDRCGVAVPPRAARPTCCRSRHFLRRAFTITGWRWLRWRAARSPIWTSRSTTTCSTGAR